MIIFGSKAKQIAVETIQTSCPNCSNNRLNLVTIQKYAHVFWIPFFPMRKLVYSECPNCKQVLEKKEMSDALRMASEETGKTGKTPIWAFSGLALLAILISIGVISENRKDTRNSILIQEPKPGDVFEIKIGSGQYTLYKVTKVVGDSVIVDVSAYETNKVTGLADLKAKGNEGYSGELTFFTKAELKQMLEEDEILDIDRK